MKNPVKITYADGLSEDKLMAIIGTPLKIIMLVNDASEITINLKKGWSKYIFASAVFNNLIRHNIMKPEKVLIKEVIEHT